MLNPTLTDQLARERRRELVDRAEAHSRARAVLARPPWRPAPVRAAAAVASGPARLARRWGTSVRSRQRGRAASTSASTSASAGDRASGDGVRRAA